jgi:2-methylcitrate dehydratase PrpD
VPVGGLSDIDIKLAKYIVDTNYEDLPANVIDVTKKSLLDGLGTMIGASGLGEGYRQFAELAISGGGKPESTIIGYDIKVPAYMAAYANGALSHALDYENNGPEGQHPNAAAITSALAMAESIGNVGGKELITAITLGCDIVCRLAIATRRDGNLPELSGWYPPPIFGIFGATTAACKLLKLEPEQILDAFSLAMCQSTCSAELIYNSNSIIRAIRDAFPAKAGILSALLAQKGIKGFARPIEGKAGFYGMYYEGRYNPSVIIKDLGKVFESATVSFKPWPSCAGTHPYIAASLQIIDDCGLNPNDIEDVKFDLYTINTMLCEPIESKIRPLTAIDAKFSIPFVIATALVYKKVNLSHFLPDALLNRDVLQVAQKITYEIHNSPEGGRKYAVPDALIQIKTKQGQISSKRIEFIYGSFQNPMSQEALIVKFKDCAGYSIKKISPENLNKAVQLILHLEEVNNICQIFEVLDSSPL